jgi:hypothetical protein
LSRPHLGWGPGQPPRGPLNWVAGAALIGLVACVAPEPPPAAPVVEAPPPRAVRPHELTGTEFALSVDPLPEDEQHARAATALLDGKAPRFLDQLARIELRARDAAGVALHGAAWVTVDYLSVGTDDDHLVVPLDLPSALAVARARKAVLPTPRLVDAIWEQADVTVPPDPLPPTDHMRGMAYSLFHRDLVRRRLPAFAQGLLVAGHKKDLVLTKELGRRRERVAIYGWHQPDGVPIQPVSVWHGAHYADYSHGVRLVAEQVEVDGRAMSIYDALMHPSYAWLFSDEGPMPEARRLMEGPAPRY